MYQTREHETLKIEDIPELETEVALSGTSKQQEVGGGLCIGIAAGIAVYYAL